MKLGIGIALLPGSNPTTQFDNIESVANAAALPASTTVGRVLYYTQDTRSWYFWNGSAWVLILDDADHADLTTVIAGLAAHLADGTDAHDASAISSVPAGTLASTDVQAALNELDGDIQGHITDATDAHAGTAITNTPAGTIAATTVQAAINELDGDIQAHLGDTTDAHDASAISVAPTGNLAADDVQEALQELQGDIDTINNRGYTVVANSALTNASTFTPAANPRQVQQVSGNGGAITLTDLDVTNAEAGDELVLMGTDDTNTVTLVSATNTVMNGSCTLAANDMITFIFISSKWREQSRSA